MRRVLLAFALMVLAIPAFAGENRDLIELKAQVQQLLRMQQSIDEKMGVMQENMKTLMQQLGENLSRVSTSVDKMDKAMAQQSAASDSCVDQLTGQAQPLHDALTELKGSVAAINKQLADMNASRQQMPSQQQGTLQQPTGNASPR